MQHKSATQQMSNSSPKVDQTAILLTIVNPIKLIFAANFKNSLTMNVLSTLCTTIFFITLIVWHH